jgi:hypothetical protein
VKNVASETREQRVRVELAVLPTRESTIPLQHGMPGVAEVEVERVAPLALLVRSLGHALSGQDLAASETRSPNEGNSR